MESNSSFDVEDIHNFFKEVWAKTRRAEDEKLREESEWPQESEVEGGIAPEDPAESSKKPRTTANSNALKVTCELLRLFVSEAVQRAGLVTDIEGLKEIDETHLWRIVSELMHDF
ncbi:unnamed protein product [Calypogeia fissa]